MPFSLHTQLTGKSSTAAEPHEKLENKSPAIRRRENNSQAAIRGLHKQASKFHNCKEPGNIYIYIYIYIYDKNNINGKKLLQNAQTKVLIFTEKRLQRDPKRLGKQKKQRITTIC
jgi:FtsZ-interacting cell division protein ZipA